MFSLQPSYKEVDKIQKKMWFKIVILSLLPLIGSALLKNTKDVNPSAFAHEIELWTKQNNETELFKIMIELLQIPTELQNSDWRTFEAESSDTICILCGGIIEAFLKMHNEGMSEETIKERIIKLCVLTNIQKENVCRGVIELNLPIIMYIIDANPNLTAPTICGVVLESKLCPLTDPAFEWNIDIANNSNTIINETEVGKPLNILQISDFHYDPLYEPNGNANCGEPLCCRKGQNDSNASLSAGYWGDYNSCDTPWHSIIDALDHIQDTHKNINYVYFTGDVIDHGVWETSKSGNTESLKQIYNKIHDTFKNIPVYPILGNHEPHPLNQFAPKSIAQDYLSTNWLYELLADLWIGYDWLPESARSTILTGGYYTVSPTKGFRVIALNSNVCYTYNWWLLYNPRDPDGQLQWLANTLLEAENNGEFVHILSHIPVNSNSCLKTWKREYLRIVNRFSHLIKAEFNGHSHNDELVVIYNPDAEAINTAWNGGSITTYSNLNPNYKLYTANSGNYAIIDYENWMYDLESANGNIHAKPTWYKSYTFKAEYGLSNLSPSFMSRWLPVVANNETLLNKYYKNFYKQARPSLQNTCDSSCKKQLICRTVVQTENTKLCDNFLKI